MGIKVIIADLPIISSLDILGGLLAGALVILLLTWPRARPRIGRAHLTPRQSARTVTMADPFLLRLATYLFRPWLVQLGHFYPPRQRPRQQQRLLWAGLEHISLGAWVGMHLLTASLGILAMTLLVLVIAPAPLVSVVLIVGCGLFYLILPERWLADRLRRRDRAMESQLIPWLRSIASQLRGSTPLVDAIRLATEVLQRSTDRPTLPAGVTDLYAEALRMGVQMDQGQLASDALIEMAERCHQTDVRRALLGMRRALLVGSTLADTLLYQAKTAQQRIRSRRLRSLGRRLTFVTGITVVAAFLLYVGSIGGILVVGIFKGFSALH
jgi:hypothetical protein